MSLSGHELDELEQDALTELVNIGVSHAAASLRKMVGQHILLSVSPVEVVSRTTVATLIGEREQDHLIAVSQAFEGALAGRALLIFPESNSLELVRAVLGDRVGASDRTGHEQDTLAGIGRVILNGCLATLADMLRQSLDVGLPQVQRGSGRDVFGIIGPAQEEGQVLFLSINFSMRERDLRGYIAMLMDIASLGSLKLLIGEFIARVMSDDPAAVVDARAARARPLS